MFLRKRLGQQKTYTKLPIMVQQKPSYASFFSKPPPQQQDRTEPKQYTEHLGNTNQEETHTDSRVNIPRRPFEVNQTHLPNTTSPERNVYILTFLTDAPSHKAMTDLRTQYFPRHLNRLNAHLTLFHALPGSQLSSSIMPTLTTLAYSTSPFPISATTPFKLRHGIAVGVPKGRGGDEARRVWRILRDEWRGFLSEQDRAGFKAHYTIMNKEEDDLKATKAFEEVERSWRVVRGRVEGLSLWLYEKGRWKHEVDFRFEGS